jgi:nucleoside-diphosphate-sugar epimerase
MHLVTGGSGFFGSLVVRDLISQGHKVRVIDTWKDRSLPCSVEFIQGDVRDRLLLKETLKDIKIVHHTAALVPLTKSGKEFWNVNVEGTESVASCVRESQVKKMIHLSSSAVYGLPTNLPISENTPHSPIEIYGKSKSAAELAAIEVFRNEEDRLIIIRPRTILGQGRLGIFQTLFEWIRNDLPIYTIGDGENLFQFIHAKDLLSAYMKIIATNGYGAYNVGTERYGTLNELFKEILQSARSTSRIIHLPERTTIQALKLLDNLRLSPLAPWHYLTYHKDFYFDLTKIQATGWESQYSNKEMFLEAYNHYLLNSKQTLQQNESSAHRKKVDLRALNLIRQIFRNKKVKYFKK